MEYNTIIVDERDLVGRITFNRPPVNILNIEMMREINDALKSFQVRKLRVLVLDANGKAFSAGVDVSDHMGGKADEMIRVFHAIFHNMSMIEAPIVALVKGAALGGGCEVVAFCDLVLASDRAKFGQPEIKVGVFPPVAAAIFPKIMPYKRALELLLTGDIIKADEARNLGLVNQIFPFDTFEADAERFIREKIACNSAVVLRLTKKAFVEGASNNYHEAMVKIEDIYLSELMLSKDANEGLKAFIEKRPPKWIDE